MMPVVLLGGIWSGIFSPTESAAVAALWALILGTVLYRKGEFAMEYKTHSPVLGDVRRELMKKYEAERLAEMKDEQQAMREYIATA